MAVEGDSSAEVSFDEVGRFGEKSKCVWNDRGEKRRAVPSSNSDVIWIDRERDQFETEGEDALEDGGLFGREVHWALPEERVKRFVGGAIDWRRVALKQPGTAGTAQRDGVASNFEPGSLAKSENGR